MGYSVDLKPNSNDCTPGNGAASSDGSRRLNRVYFDETWVANRRRYRKTLSGSQHAVDPDTGYLESQWNKGFTAANKAVFVERLKHCRNYSQISKSIPVDIQSFYDAVAIDPKFREDVNACGKIPDRAMQLNHAIAQLNKKENTDVISDLLKRAENYK